MTVIFAKLGNHGRLGNAWLQAAATIALAYRNQDNFLFPPWEYQGWFRIPKECFVNSLPKFKTYQEPHFHYTPIPYRGNMNLLGYFQSERYFKDQEGIIREMLTPCLEYDYLNYVSIHVRRTDYLTLEGCYQILDMDYYQKAIELFNSDTKFLVFSDDLDWCRSRFKGAKFELSEERHPVKDLSKMISCSHQIIANSSFSWVAGWLNTNPSKKVVAPQKWFGPKLSPSHNTKDLIPEGWVKI